MRIVGCHYYNLTIKNKYIIATTAHKLKPDLDEANFKEVKNTVYLSIENFIHINEDIISYGIFLMILIRG